MVDIHTHILPGVDDGSQTLDDSLMMADLAVESGVRTMIATPHSNQIGHFENYNGEELQQRFQMLQEAITREKIPLRIERGMEIFASEDIPEKLKKDKLIPLGGSRYVLVEFPFQEEPEEIHAVLDDILRCGRVPVIAHPERYYCCQDWPVFLWDWLEMGCLAQINKGSVFGRFGRHAEAAARVFLDNNMVHFIASDAHSPYMRTTYMGEVRQYIEDYYSEETAYRLLTGNPGRLLRNQTISQRFQRPSSRGYWY